MTGTTRSVLEYRERIQETCTDAGILAARGRRDEQRDRSLRRNCQNPGAENSGWYSGAG